MAYLRRRRTKELRDEYDARGKPSSDGRHETFPKRQGRVVPMKSDCAKDGEEVKGNTTPATNVSADKVARFPGSTASIGGQAASPRPHPEGCSICVLVKPSNVSPSAFEIAISGQLN
jgi:hypothetical protein